LCLLLLLDFFGSLGFFCLSARLSDEDVSNRYLMFIAFVGHIEMLWQRRRTKSQMPPRDMNKVEWEVGLLEMLRKSQSLDQHFPASVNLKTFFSRCVF